MNAPVPVAVARGPVGIACSNGHPNAADRLYCSLCLAPLAGALRGSVTAATTGSIRGIGTGGTAPLAARRTTSPIVVALAVLGTAIAFVVVVLPINAKTDTPALVFGGQQVIPPIAVEGSCGSALAPESPPSQREFRLDAFADAGVTEEQWNAALATDPNGAGLGTAFDAWINDTYRSIVKTCRDPVQQRRLIGLGALALGWVPFLVTRLR